MVHHSLASFKPYFSDCDLSERGSTKSSWLVSAAAGPISLAGRRSGRNEKTTPGSAGGVLWLEDSEKLWFRVTIFCQPKRFGFLEVGLSENVVYPLKPMVLLIIILLNGYNWEYTIFSDTPKLGQKKWSPVRKRVQLVNITPMSLWFMVPITIVFMGFINHQTSLGGPTL